jgi:hypothetical protein
VCFRSEELEEGRKGEMEIEFDEGKTEGQSQEQTRKDRLGVAVRRSGESSCGGQ